MSGTPIELTLYNKDDEPIKTLTRSTVKWGILKRAARLAAQFEDDDKPENGVWAKFWRKAWSPFKKEDESAEARKIRAISQFVVDLFDNQFTIKELEDGADITEVMAVFQNVLARASVIGQNPMRPFRKK